MDFTKSKAGYNTNVVGFMHEIDPGLEAYMPFMYPVLALNEEAGEVAGKVSKFIRKFGTDTEELGRQVLPELGDVLFNVSETARMFGYTLQDVVNYNVEKLNDREAHGVLIGSGDNR